MSATAGAGAVQGARVSAGGANSATAAAARLDSNGGNKCRAAARWRRTANARAAARVDSGAAAGLGDDPGPGLTHKDGARRRAQMGKTSRQWALGTAIQNAMYAATANAATAGK